MLALVLAFRDIGRSRFAGDSGRDMAACALIPVNSSNMPLDQVHFDRPQELPQTAFIRPMSISFSIREIEDKARVENDHHVVLLREI
jgi:hypothetical protein